MAFEDITMKLNLLFTQMENEPEDAHELLEQLHQELNQMKATGQPLPDDLVQLEKRLERELLSRSQAKPG